MNLKILKLARFFRLINKTKYDEKYQIEIIKQSPLFNAKWYLTQYPDVKSQKMSAAKHYLKYGWQEGRNPSKKFNNNIYLDLHNDVKCAHINPLLHYEKYGKKEGRKYKNEQCSIFYYKLIKIIRSFKRKTIKTVILFSHELTHTGAPLSLLKAAECLKKQGYQIITISLKDGSLAADFKKISKVYISKNINKNCLIASLGDFAIINTAVLYNEYNALKNILPTVWWIREPASLLKKNKFIKSALMNAENVYTMSEYSRDEYLSYNSNIKIIKHGLDDYYSQNELNASNLHFAVIGSIDHRKGQDIFIDAVNKLPHALQKRIRFSIIGKVYDPKVLQNIKGSVVRVLPEFTNHSEMIKYYENISCVVVPSRAEPTSRVALEAMMMGRPVIISDQVGAKYILNEGKNGYCFTSENATELANCMKKMTASLQKSAAKIEKNCREAYLANNSLKVYNEALIQMINATLENYRQKKLLVHLHLYYHEQLDYFISKLKNITCPYDLYVTYVIKNEKSIHKLKEFKQDVKLISVPNKGYDLAPFVHILNAVNLDDYDYILKLHTKNFRTTYWCYKNIKYTKYQWRNALVNALIGSKRIFNQNIKDLTNEFIGMIGNKDLIAQKGADANEKFRLQLCKKLSYNPQLNSYIAGTMFICKSFIMKDIQKLNLNFNDFVDTYETGATGTLAHAMESIVGHTVENNGLKILGRQVFNFHKLLDNCYILYINFKKKQKHSDYHYIKHSKYFNKKWYLKTYHDIRKPGIDPVEHYLKNGWKENYNPGPAFNTAWYLKRYKDIKMAGMNPLLHYEKYGKYEGRSLKSNNLSDNSTLNKKLYNNHNSGTTKRKRKPKLIVSLTSYPARINEVCYTIYSLLEQSTKPDEIVLWLGSDKFPNKEKDLPEILLNMRKRGLTIQWCKDIRSYTKLVPALKRYPDDIIVTADDDIYYPKDWLEKLYKAYQKNPEDIICHRVHFVTQDCDGKIKPYKEWKHESRIPQYSYLNFLTGVGGVLYPPHCLHKDVIKNKLFQKLAPLADDIWFWAMAVLNGTKIRNIKNGYTKLQYVNEDREMGLINGQTLASENVVNGKNDEQLQNILKKYPELYKKFNDMPKESE